MRRIPLSRRSHVTGFQPLPTGVAEHESALERDFVALATWRDPSATITSQPITIHFEHQGERRRYTPDFLVRWSDGHADLVEIKYRSDLKTQWKRLRPAFAAARSWASARGATFKIITERAVRVPELDLAMRLLPLRSAPVDAGLVETVRAVVAEGLTFGALIEKTPAPREAALAVVWRMIARGWIRVDIAMPVTPASKVWLA